MAVRRMLVHGLGGRVRDWDALLAELPGENHCVRLPGHDLPGHDLAGHDLPGHDLAGGEESFEGWVAAVIAELEEISGCETLIGHSMGGVMGLEVAARRPDLLERVVLLDSSIQLGAAGVEARRVWNRMLAAEDWYAQSRAALAGAIGERMPTELRERVLADLEASSRQAVRDLLVTAFSVPAEERVGRVGVPLLYVAATREVSPAALAELAEHARHTTLQTGHWPHLDDPAGTAAAIIAFETDPDLAAGSG